MLNRDENQFGLNRECEVCHEKHRTLMEARKRLADTEGRLRELAEAAGDVLHDTGYGPIALRVERLEAALKAGEAVGE